MSPHHPWSERFSERFLEVSLEQAFDRLVTEHRRSRCMSMRHFSLLAVGDPGFVGCRFSRGRSARLVTVDRALGFMGEPVFRPFLLGELEAYLAITGIQAYLLGERSVANPSFVCRFRSGQSPLLRSLDRTRRWMHANSTAEERVQIRTEALKNAGVRRARGSSVVRPEVERSTDQGGNGGDSHGHPGGGGPARAGVEHARLLPRQGWGSGVLAARRRGALPVR